MFTWIQANPFISIILGAVALIVLWVLVIRWGKNRQK